MATTFAAIRAHFAGSSTARGRIEQLTPTLRAGDPFTRSRRRHAIRTWADGKSNCLRHFDFVVDGAEEVISEAHGQDVMTVLQPALVTIAYPALPLLGGADELDSLEDLIASDAAQVRDCLFSPGNLLADLYHVMPTILAVERGDDVWFQEIGLLLQFRKSQTLT